MCKENMSILNTKMSLSLSLSRFGWPKAPAS